VTTSHSHSGPPLAPATMIGRKALVFLDGAPERPYDLETLLRASAEVLSKGVYGTTYRATLDGGLPREVRVPEDEFRDTAAAIGVLRHENLPRLRAYFYGGDEKLLVYDFVCAGRSLSSLLHGPSPPASSCVNTLPFDHVQIVFLALQRCGRACAHGLHVARWQGRAAWRTSTAPARRTAT
jgi:hypothetical protein